MRRLLAIVILLCSLSVKAQVNTNHMMDAGNIALYFEDYVLAIKYFNQVIGAKPYLADPYYRRAIAKFNLGDYAGAVEDCSEAISRSPFVTGSYEIRSWAYAILRKYNEAIEDYKIALKYKPYALNLWHNYALCYRDIGDYDGAMAVLDTIRAKAPSNTFPLRLRSEIHMKQGDTLAAIANLDTLLTMDKYDHSAYMARATINLQLEHFEEVEKDLTQAIWLSPQTGYYINRGLARIELGNLKGAMEDYNIAIDLEPQNPLARMNRALLREKIGDYNRAIEDYSFVLECVPDHIRARYARALLLKQAGDWQGSINDLTKLLQEFPYFETGYELRAEMYRNMGLTAQAEADDIAAFNAKVWATHLNVDSDKEPTPEDLEKRKRRQEANDLNNYNKQEAAKNPENTYVSNYSSEYRGQIQYKDVYVALCPVFAMTYYKNTSEVDAMIHYHRELEMLQRISRLPLPLQLTASEQALNEEQISFHFKDIDRQTAQFDKGGDESILYFVRGLDYYLVQDLSAAIDDFTQAIVSDGPTLWMSYFCRAVARYKQKQSARSNDTDIDETKKATLPEDFVVDASLSDYQFILSDLNKAIDLAPDFAYSYYNRGNVLSQLKDYHAAIVSYDEAIELEPNLAEAYYNRGLTYIFLGENARGVADLSKAGELGLYNAYNLIKRFAE